MARRPKPPERSPSPARSSEPDWSLKLARPVQYRGFKLETLADGLELVRLQPANRQAYPTWKGIRAALEAAAAAGDKASIEAATEALDGYLRVDPALRPRTRPRR